MIIGTWKLELGKTTVASFFPIFENKVYTSLDQINLSLPEGAYTTFRTYNHHQVLKLNDHFKRLSESTCLAGYDEATDFTLIREVMRRILAGIRSDQELRIRLTWSFSEGKVFYYSLETLDLPSRESYENGVSIITGKIHRNNAKAKLTSFIPTANQFRGSFPPGVNEMVMLDEKGNFLEGLSSNFFAVHENVVRTAEDGVLSGLTRKVVLELIQKENIPLQLIPLNYLEDIQEAFITSVSRGVLPINKIDDRYIGKPGRVTRKIMQLFETYLNEELEDI